MKGISEIFNRIAGYGSFGQCNSLLGLAALAFLLAGCGNGNNPAAIPGEVTFAKSFGGPWKDSANELAVDAEGRLVIAGNHRADAVGGTEDLPWVIALDSIGDARWQITPTTPLGIGGGSSVESLWIESTASGGGIRLGKVWNTETGWDVFMQRGDNEQNMLWTVELDSGEWDGQAEIRGEQRHADDHFEIVLGDENRGWYVVASSRANIRLHGSEGDATLFMNAPSIIVWYVEPGGDVRWSRRITARFTQEDFDNYLLGPEFVQATLGWDHKLALALRNLNPLTRYLMEDEPDPSITMLILNDGNGITTGVDSESFPPGAKKQDLFQTSDVVNDVIDPLRDDGYLFISHNLPGETDYPNRRIILTPALVDLLKFDRVGNEAWRLQLEPPNNDSGAYFHAVAQTFPDGGPSWIWVAGHELIVDTSEGDIVPRDDVRRRLVLWRIDMSGDVDGRCNFAEDSPYKNFIQLSATDGGRNLLAMVSGVDESGFSEWYDLIIDPQCAIVSVERHQFTPSPDFNWPRNDVSHEVLGLETLSTGEVSLQTGGNGKLQRIDEFGRVTQILPYMRYLSVAPHLVDALGRTWVAFYRLDDGCRTLVRVTDDGKILNYEEDTINYKWGMITDDGGLIFIAYPCAWPEGPLPDGWSLVHIDADGQTSFQPLPSEAPLPVDTEDTRVPKVIDSLDGALLFSLNEFKLSHYGNSAETRWRVRILNQSGYSQLIDAVLAHDGGVVILMLLREVTLPAGLIDAPQTRGDYDIGLLKLDAQGRPQWLRVFGGAANDVPVDLQRTPHGYAVLAESGSFDAVTPGSQDIWVLQTGVDGHIEADAQGKDHCQACLGSLSGQALLDFIGVAHQPMPPLPPAMPLQMAIKEVEISGAGDQLLKQTDLPSQNTARQCFGDASDLQEAALGGSGPMFGLSLTVDGSAGSTVSIMPGAIDCDGDCYEIFPAGSEIVLEDNTGLGWQFEGFSGDADCGDGMLTMDADRHCSATFVQPTLGQPLSVTLIGSGQVQSSPPGINCGENCNQHFDSGSQVTLTATAGPGFTFSSWSDDCVEQLGAEATVTMDGPKNCSATFQSAIQTFSLTAATSGSGDVVSTPAGIDTQTGDNSEVYASVTNVTLRGIPGVGQVFGNWVCLNNSAGLSQGYSTPEIDITVDDDWICTASFKAPVNPVELALTVVGDQATITEPIANLQCVHPGALSGPTVCRADYSSGTNLTLDIGGLAAASSRADWFFVCDSYQPTVGNVRACVYTITANTNITLEVR